MIPEFRAACFILSVIAMVISVGLTVYRWRAMDPPDRLVRVGYSTLLAAAGYGFANVPTPATNAIRYLVFIAALTELVFALTWMAYRQIKRTHQEENHGHHR